MSFTSNLFFVFIAVFFALWRAWPRHRFQLVSVASLVFYGSWNPLYVPLLIASSGIAFVASHLIHRCQNRNDPRGARRWLWLGIASDLGILCYFKYFNFFQSAGVDLARALGLEISASPVEILLPVGISFYTFQSISHTVDVYRRDLIPHRSFMTFLLFESLFPHLVAGPIQKASFLVPQVAAFREGKLPTSREKTKEGLDLILRGYFKKFLVADMVAPYVGTVFSNLELYRLPTIGLATLAFTVQIYCDFSGYTDIARGLAKTMGFEFSLNFDYPYLSRSIAEFWRRWHISLSSWLRDYLYIPLGGSRGSRLFTARNLMLTMLLGGLWHGANYTFLVWGFYQGLLLVLHKEWSIFAERKGIRVPDVAAWALTMGFVAFGWYIFRIEKISDLGLLASKLTQPLAGINYAPTREVWLALAGFLSLHFFEFLLKGRRYSIMALPRAARFAAAALVLLVIFLWSPSQDQAFIYFQF